MEENYYQNSSNVARTSSNGLCNITHAGLFARFVAVIVDLAIMSFVFFGLLIFVQKVIVPAAPYAKRYEEQYYQYNVESGLFDYDQEKGGVKQKTFENYKGYEDMFYSYYTDYLVNKAPEESRVNYNGKENYWFNVHILGQPDDLNLYENDVKKLNDLIKTVGLELYTYKLDADNKPIYDEVAIPRCLNNETTGVISNENQQKLTSYFYIPDADNKENKETIYHIATISVGNLKHVSRAYDNWWNHYYNLPIIFCFSFSMLVFFFAIPMIFKNGETLGKLIFHLCLVNKLGYRYNRLQLIPRFLFMMVIIIALYLFLGANIWFLGIVTFLALVSYGLAIFTKDHKAIHDYIAGTIVVDKVHSEIFENATQEDRIKKEINSVQSVIHDVEMPKDDSVLYVNENFNKKKDDKEG